MKKLIEEYKTLGLDSVIEQDNFSLSSITCHSAQIEGSSITLDEVNVLLNDNLLPSGKGKKLEELYMVLDHHKALQYILESKHLIAEIDEQLIQNINALVLQNTGGIYTNILGTVDASKGEFRNASVSVQGTSFPHHEKVKTLISQFCTNIKNEIYKADTIEKQLNLSFAIHFNFVSIHPFFDGNGRTSRLLMNMIQSYFDLPLCYVNSSDKLAYYNALTSSRKNESISVFYDFMNEQYKSQLSTKIKVFKKQQKSYNKGFNFLF